MMMGPPTAGGPYFHPSPAYPSQESANALQRAIESMEEKGLQNDPRYASLLTLRARSMHSQDQGSQFRAVSCYFRRINLLLSFVIYFYCKYVICNHSLNIC